MNYTINFTEINYLGYSESLTDIQIIHGYCQFLNENILYQILFLLVVYIMIAVIEGIIKTFPKLNVLNKIANGLNIGFEMAIGFWLVMTSGYIFTYMGLIDETVIRIGKFILFFIVCIIIFALYSLGYIHKFLKMIE